MVIGPRAYVGGARSRIRSAGIVENRWARVFVDRRRRRRSRRRTVVTVDVMVARRRYSKTSSLVDGKIEKEKFEIFEKKLFATRRFTVVFENDGGTRRETWLRKLSDPFDGRSRRRFRFCAIQIAAGSFRCFVLRRRVRERRVAKSCFIR